MVAQLALLYLANLHMWMADLPFDGMQMGPVGHVIRLGVQLLLMAAAVGLPARPAPAGRTGRAALEEPGRSAHPDGALAGVGGEADLLCGQHLRGLKRDRPGRLDARAREGAHVEGDRVGGVAGEDGVQGRLHLPACRVRHPDTKGW